MTLETERAVLLRYTDGTVPRRGSGLRIGGTFVLTARHCALGQEHLVIVGGREYVAEVVWRSNRADVDLAVLSSPALPAVAPLACAQVGTRVSATVRDCVALGFPRWNDREGAARRVQANGWVDGGHGADPYAAPDDIQLLTFKMIDPRIREIPVALGDQDTDGSPWGGMSGAVVVSGDAEILGVVRGHATASGAGAITFTPLTAVEALDPALAQGFWELLGVDDPRKLPVLPTPEPAPAGLRVTFLPPGLGAVTASSTPQHFGQAVDIATVVAGYRARIANELCPPVLRGREAESAALAEFCAADAQCLWWQAGPWAGKTGLLATFALHPPPKIDVVCFFIRSKVAGEGDRTGYLSTVVPQLAALAGTTLATDWMTTSPVATYYALLELAALGSMAAGRRLVLLVDGLDEDIAAVGERIIDVLPNAGADLRVICASRLLSDDVALPPLLRGAVVRALHPSPFAADVETLAKAELRRLLTSGDELRRDLIGLITASGGGLSVPDLAALTKRWVVDVEEALATAVGRCLTPVLAGPDIGDAAGLVLGHAQLRVQAEMAIGTRIGAYRNVIHEWAAGYAAHGWPADTPEYLLVHYPRLLTDLADRDRLVELAVSAERHERLFVRTGADGAALTEIGASLEILATEPDPDLAAVCTLARHRHHLVLANDAVPEELLIAWVLLGNIDRALTAARTHSERTARAKHLAAIAITVANAGDHGRAEAISSQIGSAGERVRALAGVADAMASTGDRVGAERLAKMADELASTVAKTWDGTDIACALVRPHARLGNTDAVTDIVAAAVADESLDADRVMEAAASAGALRDPTIATQWVSENTWTRSRIDEAVAVALAKHGRPMDAELMVARAEDSWDRDQLVKAIAEALAENGDLPEALKYVEQLDHGSWRSQALGAIAAVQALRGDPAGAAESISHTDDPISIAQHVCDLVAGAGDHDTALAVAQQVCPIDQLPATLATIARSLAGAGDIEGATRTARLIADTAMRESTLSELPPFQVSRYLVTDPSRWWRLGRRDLVASYAERTLGLLRHVGPDADDAVSAALIGALIALDELDEAHELALRRDAESGQRESLAAVAVARALAGDVDTALAMLADVRRLGGPCGDVLVEMAGRLVNADRLVDAFEVLADIDTSDITAESAPSLPPLIEVIGTPAAEWALHLADQVDHPAVRIALTAGAGSALARRADPAAEVLAGRVARALVDLEDPDGDGDGVVALSMQAARVLVLAASPEVLTDTAERLDDLRVRNALLSSAAIWSAGLGDVRNAQQLIADLDEDPGFGFTVFLAAAMLPAECSAARDRLVDQGMEKIDQQIPEPRERLLPMMFAAQAILITTWGMEHLWGRSVSTEPARRLALKGLDLAVEVGDNDGTAVALAGLALTLLQCNETEAGFSLLGKSIEAARHPMYRMQLAMTLTQLRAQGSRSVGATLLARSAAELNWAELLAHVAAIDPDAARSVLDSVDVHGRRQAR